MFREAIELHRQGRLDEAEQACREHLQAQPNDIEALRLLATLRRERGDLAEAERVLLRAHELAPEQPVLLLQIGALRYQGGDFERSRDAYERALALDPNIAGAHTTLGHIALMRGDAKLGEQYFRTALRVQEDPQAVAGIGMIALDAGDAETALKYLTRAADLAPNEPGIQFVLGRCFAARGMRAFAEQAFINTLRLRPQMHHAANALGQLLIENERPAEAENLFRSLCEAPGFELAGELGLADALRAQGRHAEAVEWYRAALAREPGHAAAVNALAWSLVQLGRADEAAAVYAERIAAEPSARQWRLARASLYLAQQRFAEAAEDWQALHEADPADPQAAVQLALLREHSGDFDAASKAAEAAASLRPDEPEIALLRVRAALRGGQLDTAAALLEPMARQPLTEGQARLRQNYLGHVADRRGDAAAAVKYFAEAQRGATSLLPSLSDVPAELDRLLAEPAAPAWEQAPVLLIGLPGSGVERLAALLALQPGLTVLGDRAGNRQRRDGFGAPDFDRYLGELSDEDVAALRNEYLAPLAADGVPLGSDSVLVDWLPRWDARLLALAHRTMPGTRVIVADADPRDALVNWLAFGWLPSAALSNLEPAPAWMARARAHLNHGAGGPGPQRLTIDPAAVLTDPTGEAGAELARFLGLPELVSGEAPDQIERGLGGLPTRFASGHWRAYESALGEAFAQLAD